MKRRLMCAVLVLASSVSAPAWAQNFTTAAEVKPIVSAIKGQWIAVRLWDGQDLLYFTNLLSWRCGLSEIKYAVNGGKPVTYDGEPCYEGEAAPNALKLETSLPYVTFPPKTIETIDVFVTFDDDTEESAHYKRAAVQIN